MVNLLSMAVFVKCYWVDIEPGVRICAIRKRILHLPIPAIDYLLRPRSLNFWQTLPSLPLEKAVRMPACRALRSADRPRHQGIFSQ